MDCTKSAGRKIEYGKKNEKKNKHHCKIPRPFAPIGIARIYTRSSRRFDFGDLKKNRFPLQFFSLGYATARRRVTDSQIEVSWYFTRASELTSETSEFFCTDTDCQWYSRGCTAGRRRPRLDPVCITTGIIQNYWPYYSEYRTRPKRYERDMLGGHC